MKSAIVLKEKLILLQILLFPRAIGLVHYQSRRLQHLRGVCLITGAKKKGSKAYQLQITVTLRHGTLLKYNAQAIFSNSSVHFDAKTVVEKVALHDKDGPPNSTMNIRPQQVYRMFSQVEP